MVNSFVGSGAPLARGLRHQATVLGRGWKCRLVGDGPLGVTFFATAACNAACSHCLDTGKPAFGALSGGRGRRHAAPSELVPGEVERIAGSLRRPVSKVLVTGGEPFLRADLAALVALLHTIGGATQITISTNGSLCDRVVEQGGRLAASCPEARVIIRFSVDGPPGVHDAIRGIPVGFERLVACIGRLRSRRTRHPNLFVELCTTLSVRNQHEYGKLLAELDARGVPETPLPS